MALVSRRYDSAKGNLLAAVGGIDVKTVVVDTNPIVWIAGGDGDLEIGGEEVGDRGVESVDGGVLDDELGLGRTKDGPYQENHQEDDEEENDNPPENAAEELSPFVAVVATVFGHGGDSSSCQER